MSTITDKLTRLASYKEDIKNAIINKGQSVGNNMSLYANAISKITTGGGIDIDDPNIPKMLDTDPLSFVLLDDVGYIGFTSGGNKFNTINYRINDGNWLYAGSLEKYWLKKYDKIQFKSTSTDAISNSSVQLIFDIKSHFVSGGNTISLYNNYEYVFEYGYYRMFQNCTGLLTAPTIHLDGSGNSYRCANMFQNCTGLIRPPKFVYEGHDKIDVAAYDFQNMFDGCVSLQYTPEFNFSNLHNYSCANMFQNCRSLKETADFSNINFIANYSCTYMYNMCTGLTTLTTLKPLLYGNESFCYSNMFYGCTGLTSLPENLLPATTLASSCYFNMFNGCTGLTSLPENLLPATTLASSCYSYMFYGCTSLVNAPELPATTLASNCYSNMFNGCTGLTSLPENLLPATTLATGCYSNMFYGCTSLVNAPELPATTLANQCYSYMFDGCTSLQVSPKIYATHYYSGRYLQSMFSGCTNLKTIYCNAHYTNATGTTEITTNIGSSWLSGVPNTEDCIFYKNPEWAGPTSRGNNTIPSNWTIVDWIQ